MAALRKLLSKILVWGKCLNGGFLFII
jgi:hypothetical protein